MVSMNKLSGEKRAAVVAALVEGNSIRATCRMTGVAKATVMKLLTELGIVCSIYQDELLRNLYIDRVQCDEIWSFVGAKQRNVREERKAEGWGDAWTWVAIDPGSKLVISYRVGPRDATEAKAFMNDLAARLHHRVQLTTDGHHSYLVAVKDAFRDEIDYAQLIKVYGTDQDSRKPERRYSPGVCIEAIPQAMIGSPDPRKISTSHIERQNLTMRMSIRRFTRLTNAFSKKLENHAAAISLHFMHYNFVRVHQTIGTTPAVAAGVAARRWKIADIIALLDEAERAVPVKRGPYKKRAA
jgi:IS1 family transposase